VAGLSADSGRVPRNLINQASGQRYPLGLWTPPDYGELTTTDDEVTLFTWDISDPGTTARLFITGSMPVSSNHQAATPEIVVRVGADDGPIIARGLGSPGFPPDDDDFNRVGSDLGEGWDEFWTGTGTGHVETDGIWANYVKQGSSSTRQGIFRKVDSVTRGDGQEVMFQISTENEQTSSTRPNNYLCARMSENGQDWVGVAFRTRNNAPDASSGTVSVVHLVYSIDGVITDVNETGIPCRLNNTSVYRLVVGTEDNDRQVLLYRDSDLIVDLVESNHLIDAQHRGWGWGVRAGSTGSAQIAPASVSHIIMHDTTPHADPQTVVPVMPTDFDEQEPISGPVTLYVQLLRNGNAGTVTAGYDADPSLAAVAIPAEES